MPIGSDSAKHGEVDSNPGPGRDLRLHETPLPEACVCFVSDAVQKELYKPVRYAVRHFTVHDLTLLNLRSNLFFHALASLVLKHSVIWHEEVQ